MKMSIQRHPETGKIIARKFTLEQIEEANDQQAGFCIACGAWRDCCEPDAREYTCEECGLPHVYGAQELVIMGRVVSEF
jgi:hypothetical protein